MKSILSEQERAALGQLIAGIEQNTAGELVLVVARRSASYGGYRAVWAAASALVTVTLIELGAPRLPVLWLFGLQAPLGLLFWWVYGNAWALRRIVPRQEQDRRVNNRVKQLFLEQGITETRDRSGVLLFLSELERRVEILADKGIHEVVGAEAWTQMVESVVQEIRRGSAAAGLTAIIERIGQVLSEKFPPRADDTNELPNAVVDDHR